LHFLFIYHLNVFSCFLKYTSVIEPLLGTELYDKIYTEAEAVTLTGDYLILYDNYIKPIVKNTAVAEYLTIASYMVQNGGIFKKTGENIEVVDKQEVQFLAQKYNGYAQMFIQRFNKWICKNPLPEYKCYQDEVNATKDIKVTAGTWYISPSEYSKVTDTLLLDIALCSAGLLKYVDIIGDDSGAISIISGTEGTTPTHQTIDTNTQVLLGYVLVGDSLIEEPTPVLSDVSLQDAYNAGRFMVFPDNEPIEIKGNEILRGRDNYLEYKLSLSGNGDFSTKGAINEYAKTVTAVNGANINEANTIYLTGSGVTINSFQGNVTFLTSPVTHSGSRRTVIFDGINTLVHGSGLDLLTGANIITATGDIAIFIATYANQWGMIDYVRYDGTALVGGGSGTTDLSITNRTATTLDVASSTGAAATIPESTPSLAGLQSAADKVKIDKFVIDIEYQSGALLATVYFETVATLTLVRKESTINTIEVSTNGGGSYSSITAGVVSIAMPALTYVIFRITYVTPSDDAGGNIYLEGTY